MLLKIPRAYYYMSIFEPLRSIIGLILGNHRSTKLVQSFESEYLNHYGHKNVACVSHARVALYLCLKSYDYELGDEVLMTPINIPDMVNMIRISGLKERYVDILADDYSIDLEDAKSKITTRTRFLFVTHLNGFVPNMDKIQKFAKDNNLILIQDCTQSAGATYKGRNIECYGELSFLALCDLKVIHTHMGGVIVSEDASRLQKIKKIMKEELKPLTVKYFSRFLVEDIVATLILNRYIFSYLVNPLLGIMNKLIGVENIESFTKGGGLKIGPVYFLKGLFGGGGNLLKSEIPEGMLYQFSDLQAKIGLRRLKSISSIDERRILNSKRLLNDLKLPGEMLPSLESLGDHVFWKFPLRIKEFREFQEYLLFNGIDSARSNLLCLNEYECFGALDKTPVASFLSKNSLYIPAHPNLTSRDMDNIVEKINSYFKSNS